MFDWLSASLVIAALSVSYTIIRNLTLDGRAVREKKEKALADIKAHGEKCRTDFDAYKEVSSQQLALMMDVVRKSTDMHVAVATLLTSQKHIESTLSKAEASIAAVQSALNALTEKVYERT